MRFGRDSGRSWSTSCTAVSPVARIDDHLVDRKARNYNIGGHRYSGEKLRAYIRARRNPLLDKKLFHRRDQEEGESIDQYVAAVIRINRTCAYDNEPHCTRCHRPCGHDAALTETRIRDRLIYRLADGGIQQHVLEEDFSERLDLERVVAICKSMESSEETELRLTREISPSTQLASRTRSTS